MLLADQLQPAFHSILLEGGFSRSYRMMNLVLSAESPPADDPPAPTSNLSPAVTGYGQNPGADSARLVSVLSLAAPAESRETTPHSR
jgi:hypothetical protein